MTSPSTNRSTALLAALLLVAAGAAPAALGAETYELDPVHTSVVFKVKHLDIAWIYGTFEKISGRFVVDEADPSRSQVSIQIDTASVDTDSEKRDQHLRNPDFLNAKIFPKATFEGKSYEKVGEHVARVTGDLTLHGVTRTMTLDVERTGQGKDPWGGERIGFHTEFTLKRSDFGMKYMLEGIGDEITLIISGEAVRKSGEAVRKSGEAVRK